MGLRLGTPPSAMGFVRDDEPSPMLIFNASLADISGARTI